MNEQIKKFEAMEDRPTREEAETAVRTLLRWAGDNPEREGLLETPARVAKAFGEWFGGYDEDPHAHLLKTFEEVEGYDEMVLLKDIRFESHCEHHLAPIIGKPMWPICPMGVLWGFPNFPAWWMPMPSVFRSRKK